MIAISAASPLRGPSLKICVYPPLRFAYLGAISAKSFVTVGTSIGLAPVLAAVAVIVGHSKSCFLNFQGGKSVASGVGTILALNFTVGVIIAVIWAIITYFTKYTKTFMV